MESNELAEETVTPRRRRGQTVLGIVVVAGIVVALFFTFRPTNSTWPDGAAQAADAAPEVGSLAPDFRLPALDGGRRRLGDLRGKAVVLNFWATWCPPCRAEAPELQDAYRRYRAEGLELVAVDVAEDAETVRQYLDANGLTLPVLLDGSAAVSTRYRVSALPTTFFVDRDGFIRAIQRGRLSRLTLDRHITGLLRPGR